MNIKKSKTCRQIAPLIETAANSGGEPKKIEAVDSHIALCAECRAEYQQWKQTAAMMENWRTAEVPESRRDWNDLHAHLTASQSHKLRPAFPLMRLGIGGFVGATAIALFCFFLPHPYKQGDREQNIAKIQGAASNTPTAALEDHDAELRVRSTARRNAPSREIHFAENDPDAGRYSTQKRMSYGRTFAAASPPKTKLDKPALTLAKHQESSRRLPQKRTALPQIEGGGHLIAQHKPEPQSEILSRVPLNVDGETRTPERTQEYALGAIPSGQASGIVLTPASYSSSSEKTAW